MYIYADPPQYSSTFKRASHIVTTIHRASMRPTVHLMSEKKRSKKYRLSWMYAVSETGNGHRDKKGAARDRSKYTVMETLPLDARCTCIRQPCIHTIWTVRYKAWLVIFPLCHLLTHVLCTAQEPIACPDPKSRGVVIVLCMYGKHIKRRHFLEAINIGNMPSWSPYNIIAQAIHMLDFPNRAIPSQQPKVN